MTRSTSSAASFHPGVRVLLVAYTRPVGGGLPRFVLGGAESSFKNAVGVRAGVSVMADEVPPSAAGGWMGGGLGPNQVPSLIHPARSTRI